MQQPYATPPDAGSQPPPPVAVQPGVHTYSFWPPPATGTATRIRSAAPGQCAGGGRLSPGAAARHGPGSCVAAPTPVQTPPPRQSPAQQHQQLSPDERARWAELYRQFYHLHNPAKLRDLPMLLARFAGEEHQMWAPLLEKYGVTEDNWREPPRARAAPPPTQCVRPAGTVAAIPAATPTPQRTAGRAPDSKRAKHTEKLAEALVVGNDRQVRRRTLETWVAYLICRKRERDQQRWLEVWRNNIALLVRARYWSSWRRLPLLRRLAALHGASAPVAGRAASSAPWAAAGPRPCPASAGEPPPAAGPTRMTSRGMSGSLVAADSWRSGGTNGPGRALPIARGDSVLV
eukprot:TRINITY_DN21430_c0_g1_i3.p1 TRINITY_DN21430_c0_g1~~TRINITY_DN21430_c0_g1_i3.p1  ORF type:complete len:346 (+),score=39.86 TRINITY_DN21430_c0_g1_i3:82-1119(+)